MYNTTVYCNNSSIIFLQIIMKPTNVLVHKDNLKFYKEQKALRGESLEIRPKNGNLYFVSIV